MLKFYTDNIGKYPYKKLDIDETGMQDAAMEYPCLIQMIRYPLDNDKTDDDTNHYYGRIAAHEIGHQWWHVTAGNNEFKKPLMDESINVFTTALCYQKLFGGTDRFSIDGGLRKNFVGATRIAIGSSVDMFKDMDEYSDIIYRKGGKFFEDLRERAGEEKMVSILKEYYKRYAFKNGSIQDFENVAGDIAGPEIKDYIVKAVTSPDYSTSSICIQSK